MLSLYIGLRVFGVVVIVLSMTIQSIYADRIMFGKPSVGCTIFLFVFEMLGFVFLVIAKAGQITLLFGYLSSISNTVSILVSCIIEELVPEFYASCYERECIQ